MRHLHSGNKLGVPSHHRRALLRSLTLALIEQDVIKTTPARAKELRSMADRMVTLGKRGTLNARRHMLSLLGSTQTNQDRGTNRVKEAVDKVYTELVPRFKDRPGGYTQIIRLAIRRAGDNAEMCLMRYLPPPDDRKKTASKPAQKDKAKKAAPEKMVAASAKEKKETPSETPQDKPAAKKTDKKKRDKES